MKHSWLIVLLIMGICSTALAEDVWTYKVRQINKVGEKVNIRVTTYVNGEEYAGRDMSFYYDNIKDLTLLQAKTLLTNKVRYIVQQDNPEHLLKDKIKSILNVEIPIE